jgi:signal transduction histidine kinase
VAVSVEKTEKIRDDTHTRTLVEYDSMIEELRTRLNVLSTSLFLLHESSKSDDPKLKRYLKQINTEMERIRQIISKYPKNPK